MNNVKADRMIQTKKETQQDLKHLLEVCFYFHCKEQLEKFTRH